MHTPNAMSLDECADNFKAWALRMSCPSEFIPRDAAIKRHMSSGCSSLANITNRVTSIKHVQSVRNCNLAHQLKIYENNPLSQMLNVGPAKLKNLNAVQELNQQIANHLEDIKYITPTIDTLQVTVNEKLVERDNVQRKRDALSTKTFILQEKLKSCESSCNNARKISDNIEQIMPVVSGINLTRSDVSPTKVLTDTIRTLREFYAALDATKTNASSTAVDSYQSMWASLQHSFATISNVQMWNALDYMSAENHAALVRLVESGPVKMPDTHLSVLIVKLKAKQLSAFVSTVVHNEEHESLVEKFVDIFEQSSENLNRKMELLNGTSYDEAIVNEYCTQLMLNIYTNAELVHLENHIAANNEDIVRLQKQLEHYLQIISQLRDLYKSSEQLYRTLQSNQHVLRMVKGKCEFAVSSSQQICIDVQKKKVVLNGQHQHNNSSISFDSSSDRVLCSTKLDSTMAPVARLDSNIHSGSRPAQQELDIFLDFPMNKFLRYQDAQVELVQRLFVNSSVEMPMVNLLTPTALVSTLRSINLFHGQLHHLLDKVTVNLSVPNVEINQLKQSVAESQSLALQRIDQIAAIDKRNACTLKLAKKYFLFFMNNPLAAHIPKVITYKGSSYLDYFEQFLLYYNIIKNDVDNANRSQIR